MSTAAASMSPADYGRALKRRWPVVALLTVVGLAGGFVSAHSAKAGASGAGTVSFQSTSYLSLPMGQTDPSGLSLDAMAFFATNGQVPVMAAKSLHYKGSPSGLAGQVQAKAEDKIGVLEVSASGSSPSQAAEIVRAFDNALIGYLDDQIRAASARQVANMRTQVLNLRSQINALQAQGTSRAGVASAQLQGLLGEYGSVYRQYEALLSAGPGHTDLHQVPAPTTYAAYSRPKRGASAVVPSACWSAWPWLSGSSAWTPGCARGRRPKRPSACPCWPSCRGRPARAAPRGWWWSTALPLRRPSPTGCSRP